MPEPIFSLSNDYNRCHLVNLGSNEHHGGPFAVTQRAYDSEDPLMLEAVFVLLAEGVWVDELAVAKLGPERALKILFATSAEAMQCLEALTGTPVIERYELTEQDLRQRIADWQAGGFVQRIQSAIERYRASQKPK